MPFTKNAPELFEILRRSRDESSDGSLTSRTDMTGRTTSLARRRDPTSRRRAPDDPAGWFSDTDGTPIVVADDDETREVLAALGLSLVAEHRAPEEASVGGEPDEDEDRSGEDAAVDSKTEEDSAVARRHDDDDSQADDDPTERRKRSVTPLTPVAPMGPSAAASRVPKAPRGGGRPGPGGSFGKRFLPPARGIPRRRPTDEKKTDDPDVTGAFPRVAVRADTLAAGAAAALLLLALAFLGGRATARDPEEIAAGDRTPTLEPVGPTDTGAPAPASPPGAIRELAANAAGSTAPRPAAPAPQPQPEPQPAPTPSAEATHHIQLAAPSRANMPKIVDFLNARPEVQASGFKAYAKRGKVYVGHFPNGDPTAKALCEKLKRLKWEGDAIFSGAFPRRDNH